MRLLLVCVAFCVVGSIGSPTPGYILNFVCFQYELLLALMKFNFDLVQNECEPPATRSAPCDNTCTCAGTAAHGYFWACTRKGCHQLP